MDCIRIQHARLNQLFDLRYGYVRRHCHKGIKIGTGVLVNEIAVEVTLVSLYKSEVRAERLLEYVLFAIDKTGFFVSGKQGAGAGLYIEPPDARTFCAYSFCERALGNEIESDLPCIVQFFKGFCRGYKKKSSS